MDKYLQNWLDILQGMANDNTYKLAWGRSIVEIIYMNEYVNHGDKIEIPFSLISHHMLKYYWNQTFFFNLKQSPNQKKPPRVYQIVSNLIDQYKQIENTNIPIWFNRLETFFVKNSILYEKTILNISKILKIDVCWRFLKANGIEYDIYTLDEKKETVIFNKRDAMIIKEYAIVLTQIMNYRWAQLLEQFNRSPRIVSKVQGSMNNQIRRKNLAKYKEILLKQFKNGLIKDFYTGETIESNDISIDHVIPWSFMYSDDLWNLVITSKSNNSKKSNNIPNEEVINKLKQRNESLLELLNDEKSKIELRNAIELDYVTKFYYDAII